MALPFSGKLELPQYHSAPRIPKSSPIQVWAWLPCLAARPGCVVGQTDTMLQPKPFALASSYISLSARSKCHCQHQDLKVFICNSTSRHSLNWKQAQKNDWNICLHTYDIVSKPFTSQKCLSASCTRKHFICFTDFPIGQVRNIGLVLCTRDETTDYLTSLLTHMHTGVWVCKSSKPIISWMTSRVRAVVSWGLVKGHQEKKISLSILFWFQMKNEINLE